MNTKKPKFLHEVENFREWFSKLEPKEKKRFRKDVEKQIWPDKPRSAFYNFYYGRTSISHLLGTKIAEIVILFDDSVNLQNLFPSLNLNLKTEMENKIWNLLSEKNMSQQDLADITKISRQLINGYASGKHIPNVINAQKIADALEVRLEDLFDLKRA